MWRLNEMKHLINTTNRNKFRQMFAKQYCSSKNSDKNKPILQEDKAQKNPEDKLTDHQSIVMDVSQKLDKNVDNENEFTSITERERDATLTGKLSKETEKLVGKKIPLTSTGLNLCLEIIKDKPPIIDGIDIERLKRMEKRPPPILDPPASKIIKRDDPDPLQQRIIRGESGEVVLGFIPKEWSDFFVPKTGVSGFYTFLITLGTYLFSKELYVLEHNYYGGLGMVVLVWGSVKYGGPHVATYLDKEIDEYEEMWELNRTNEKAHLNDAIEDELFHQFQTEGQLMLVEAKRENVAFQLEEEFRKRQMHVYNEVVKYLNYQIRITEIYRKIHHKNLIQYVQTEVLKSITPEMHNQILNISIDSLLADLQNVDDNK